MTTVFSLAAFLVTAALVPAAAVDSLMAGQSIRDNQTLVSAEGTFALGFFTGGSNGLFLGIWYNKISVRTVVWVANRRHPLPAGFTASLTMSPNGSLVLAGTTDNSVYWSTPDLALALRRPVARILDDGNFVVLGGDSNGYAWQSFDHPADTLLPGMRVGLNRRTGEKFNITSWKTAEDPAPGSYSYGLDTRGIPQMFVMNGSTPLWRGGPWIGGRFTGVPSMKGQTAFNYGFLSNSDGLYLTYDAWNKSMVSRITVIPSGLAEHLIWYDSGGFWTPLWTWAVDTCDGFGACGPNGLCDVNKSPACGCLDGFKPRQQLAAAGCERVTPLDCTTHDGGSTFVVVPGVKLPDTSAARGDASLGFEECRAACLRNCSCTAFTRGDGSGCITWFGELTDVRAYDDVYYNNPGQDLYIRVAATRQGNGKDWKKVIIIIILPITFFAMVISIIMYFRGRRQKNRMSRKGAQQVTKEQHRGKELELPLFPFDAIEFATDNFSIQNKLGEGGYGPVYKGKLHDGQYVAVKRLSRGSTQGLEQFKNEIQLVAKLQHTNLVRLLGCCIEKEEKILVYEYMSKQSLDKFIFDEQGGKQLDWAKRLHIIKGITQGLLYLHKYSRLRVIHRDLKASNILLDDEWNPKISDFGLAKIFSWNEPQANTNRIIGTYGYMPPEYVMGGLFSAKSDVFSFGVLLLEILSGKKNTSIDHFGLDQNLLGHAWMLWQEGRELELMDPQMGNLFPREEFSRLIHVALLCVQENPVDRPAILDTVNMLNNDTSLPIPNQPAFFLSSCAVQHKRLIKKEQPPSSNDVTLSVIEGR